MRKGNLDNKTLTGLTEGERSNGKQWVTYLSSLTEWMTEQELNSYIEQRNTGSYLELYKEERQFT